MLLNISPNHWCIVKINSYVIRCAYFARENNLLRLFWGIWVKYHVPLVSLPRNFSLKDSLKNSSLKDIEDTAESRTTEKSEVSSEKGLAFFVKPLSKSLIQTKKDKNSRMCDHARIDHWEPLFGVDHLGMHVSARINFHIYLETLANTLNHIMPNSIKGFW